MLEDLDQDGLLVPDWLPTLEKGRHVPHRSQLCAMEAAAWLAGEDWSDHPRSVHRVIAQVARVTNDTMTDDERQELWPLVLASIGTGAQWRPMLWYRLAHHQLMMQRKYPGNPRRVWEELLKEHARMTGRPQRPIPRTEPTVVDPSAREGDVAPEVVGAGTPAGAVLDR